MNYSYTEVTELIGKVLIRAEKIDDEEIVFETEDGVTFKMLHLQDCCESVTIEDICGDLDFLVGSPILMAEEVTNSEEPAKELYDESHTWTFYKIATIKGTVTIRWYGTSNGYYSESASFIKIK